MHYSCTIQSPIGHIRLQATDTALYAVTFDDAAAESKLSNDVLENAKLQLDEYFAGTRLQFDLLLLQPGSDFQHKIWHLLQNIPFGDTTSYLALSKQYGDVKAIRAVATANAKNRLAIVVPCHRVVGTDGSLTGFAWGIERKRWLLDHEAKTSGKERQMQLF